MKKILKRLLGKKEYIDSIYEKTPMIKDLNSYCGGDLEFKNVVLVGDTVDKYKTEINSWIKTENLQLQTINKVTDDLKTAEIYAINKELTGKIKAFVNIVGIESLLSDGVVEVNNKIVRNIYQWIQTETDYLIDNEIEANICVVVTGINKDCDVAKGIIKHMIAGLADSLGTHNLILNGVFSYKKNMVINELNTISFLISKYGQMMSGEVFEIHE